MDSYHTKSFEQFKQENALRNKAFNLKSVVIAILLVSVIVFHFMDKATVRSFIEYWLVIMLGLVIVCAIQDIVISRKIKNLRTRQYWQVNSKGIKYYLQSTTVTLRGGKPHTIYFFTKQKNNSKGSPSPLPYGRHVTENPRNGFLTIRPLGEK